MIPWFQANYGKVAAVLLSLLVAANAAFGFLSADTLAMILTVAGTLGFHAVQSNVTALHAKHDDLLACAIDESDVIRFDKGA